MKKAKEIESNKINNSLRSSIKKSVEDPIISEIVDYQMSNSTFSTTKKKKKNKRVQFNPLITVVNIESYKKENYFGEYKKVGKESDKENSCMLC